MSDCLVASVAVSVFSSFASENLVNGIKLTLAQIQKRTVPVSSMSFTKTVSYQT